MLVTPAILPDSFAQLLHTLFKVEGLSHRVHIDLCDGVFGLEKTWLPYKEEHLPHGFIYEFDLMVVDWRKYLLRVIALGGTRVVMHVDTFSRDDIEEIISIASKHKLALGLSVSNDKDLRDFVYLVNEVSSRYHKVFVQVMGIKKIGAQGQPFDENVLSRVGFIAKECKNIEIQVDGSMNPETALKVKNKGASCAVVGSYLFGGHDIKKQLDKLQKVFI